MTPLFTLTAAQRLTAEEQAVYDFVRDDLHNVRRFVEHLAAAKTTDITAAVVTRLAEADDILQSTYSDWLAMDLVGGRVHTLERVYESVLHSMLIVTESMKAVLAAPTKVLAAAAMQVALREVPRLTRRVGWSTQELDALAACTNEDGARSQGIPARAGK